MRVESCISDLSEIEFGLQKIGTDDYFIQEQNEKTLFRIKASGRKRQGQTPRGGQIQTGFIA